MILRSGGTVGVGTGTGVACPVRSECGSSVMNLSPVLEELVWMPPPEDHAALDTQRSMVLDPSGLAVGSKG